MAPLISIAQFPSFRLALKPAQKFFFYLAESFFYRKRPWAKIRDAFGTLVSSVSSLIIKYDKGEMCCHVQLFCDLMDCSPPGSSVHRILQARILEWVAMPSSRGSSRPRDQIRISVSPALAGGSPTTSATWQAK